MVCNEDCYTLWRVRMLWCQHYVLCTLTTLFQILTWSITSLKVKVNVAQSCLTLCDPMDSPRNSPGLNTEVGSLSFLQGIFPTQGSNPGLPHCRGILCQLSHKGSPRILEWVAYAFSGRSPWPRNRTGVSCIASGFFTNWDIKEVPIYHEHVLFSL